MNLGSSFAATPVPVAGLVVVTNPCGIAVEILVIAFGRSGGGGIVVRAGSCLLTNASSNLGPPDTSPAANGGDGAGDEDAGSDDDLDGEGDGDGEGEPAIFVASKLPEGYGRAGRMSD